MSQQGFGLRDSIRRVLRVIEVRADEADDRSRRQFNQATNRDALLVVRFSGQRPHDLIAQGQLREDRVAV